MQFVLKIKNKGLTFVIKGFSSGLSLLNGFCQMKIETLIFKILFKK
jgi:hypothetical protein